MLRNYLNIDLAPYAQKEDIPENTDNALLVVSEEQAGHYPFQKTLAENIGRTLKDNKNGIYTVLGGSKNFIVVLPQRDAENLRLAGASLYAFLKKEESKKVRLRGLSRLSENERSAFMEGILLSSYDFNKYRKSPEKGKVTLYIPNRFFTEEQVSELTILAQAVSLTKTLVNEPVNYLDALQFTEIAIEAGKTFGFTTELLNKEAIEKHKMGGLLAVNKGSETPPTFNIFHYKPANAVNDKPLVLVGKGVMFDTGGYSLKTGGVMSTMKCDMGGGAAVLGTVAAVAGTKLPYYVIGLVPATDNKISSNALVVDDIITMMDGTTVEVQNTDAEGRLVLADALTYAKMYEPGLVIDIATLTGASAAITGSFGIAMAGNSAEQMNDLIVSGEAVYERLFQLPFWKEFSDLLKSDIADLKNIGGAIGGASTAAKFLEHFTDYPWIHLDIAGAAFIKEAHGYRQSGATAAPVRLLYDFIRRKIQVCL